MMFLHVIVDFIFVAVVNLFTKSQPLHRLWSRSSFVETMNFNIGTFFSVKETFVMCEEWWI